jgi:Flp pilus assembly pilin Flp
MRGEEGSAAVEFALVVPLVVVALFAVVELTVVARTQLELVNAAREGARRAATVVDPAEAVSAVRAALGPQASRAVVSVRRPHVVGRQAEVTVRLRHRLGSPLLGGMPVELRARAVMRVER